MDPPDQHRATVRGRRVVDPPQRAIAIEPLGEQARDLSGDLLFGERLVRLDRADAAGDVEALPWNPRRRLIRPAEPPAQLRDSREPPLDELAQLLEPRGPGADADHLAGVPGDRVALEGEDRPVLGLEGDGLTFHRPDDATGRASIGLMERIARFARLSMRLGASMAATLTGLLVAAADAGAVLDQPTRVADVNPGPAGSTISATTVFGRHVIFRGFNPTVGDEPWATDGTAAGTIPLEVAPGPGSSIPGDLHADRRRGRVPRGRGGRRRALADRHDPGGNEPGPRHRAGARIVDRRGTSSGSATRRSSAPTTASRAASRGAPTAPPRGRLRSPTSAPEPAAAPRASSSPSASATTSSSRASRRSPAPSSGALR